MNMSGTPPHRASVDLGTSRLEPCPPPSAWPELIAQPDTATLSPPAAALLQHASRCTLCAPLLARAVQNSPHVPATEDAWLEDLPSSTPEGRRRLAETMQRVAAGAPRHATARASQAVPRNKRDWNWLGWQSLTLATAALAIVGISLWFVQRKPSDDQLLAGAYDQHRLTELRLGQGHAVALDSPTRGSASDTSSSQLLEVKLRAQQRMEKAPNDPAVRQTLGRIALVEHDGAGAIRHFEMVQSLAPSLTETNRDLAAAWFELAESSGQATDYARSIDFYGKYLQQVHGRDAAALYNRGLAWERQSVYTEAIKDFEAALALEKDPSWRVEINRHLQAARAHSAEYGRPGPPVNALTPEALLALRSESPGDYELFLQTASRQWLMQRPQTTAALEKLAAWGRTHHDNWLTDMLHAPPSAREAEAETMLSRSLLASAAGDADADLEAATAASSLFKTLGNKAGYARAEAEIVYAQQRRGRAPECQARALVLQRTHTLDAYAALQLATALELSACLAKQQNYTAARALLTPIAYAAQNADLPITRLRALAFAIELDDGLDETARAWKTSVEGLAQAERIAPAVNRRYALLYGMKLTAARYGLAFTAAGLSDATATVGQRSENLQTRAFAWEELGRDQAAIGDDDSAGHSFAAADAILRTFPPGPTKDYYFATWGVDRAPFRARHPQELPTILSDFARAEPEYKLLVSYDSKLTYYMEYADLLLQAHRPADALDKGWFAVRQAEGAQANGNTPTAKQASAETAARAYLSVIRAYLQQGKAAEALRVWLWLQAAPSRPAADPTRDLAEQLPPLPATPPGRITLILARLDTSTPHYVLWALGSDGLLRTVDLKRPAAQIETSAASLLRLCADPHSSQQDIAVLGSGLYDDLIAPAADLLSRASVLQLAVDPALSSLPFSALQHGGVFLGIKRPILFYAPGWSLASPALRQSVTAQEILPAAARTLVLQQQASTNQRSIPGEYDESNAVASSFAHAELRQAAVWREGTDLFLSGEPALPLSVPRADVLHYTGHGLARISAATSGPVTFSLQPHSLPHCRLAVLAACESLHERENIGNDVPSFARILLRAGATHVLATQWDVDSRATRDLMVQFYAGLAHHQPSPEALWKAQQSLYRHPESAHPYFWSPFQIVAQ